jgi:hypothetical protein
LIAHISDEKCFYVFLHKLSYFYDARGFSCIKLREKTKTNNVEELLPSPSLLFTHDL